MNTELVISFSCHTQIRLIHTQSLRCRSLGQYFISVCVTQERRTSNGDSGPLSGRTCFPCSFAQYWRTCTQMRHGTLGVFTTHNVEIHVSGNLGLFRSGEILLRGMCQNALGAFTSDKILKKVHDERLLTQRRMRPCILSAISVKND